MRISFNTLLLLGLTPPSTAFGAKEVPLSERDDVPWNDLKEKLVSSESVLIGVSNQDWFDECWPVFSTIPMSKRSNHDLVRQPSGVCVNSVISAFQNSDPITGSTLDKNNNISMKELGWGLLLDAALVTEFAAENVSMDDPSLLTDPSIAMLAYSSNMTTEEYVASLPSIEEIENVLDPLTNPSYDIPLKVIFPKVAGDIVAAVEFGMSNSVELSVKNSGHHYAGASTKKDTLLVNMYHFEDYSPTNIVDCSTANDDGLCDYVSARNVPGYIRVGGGESWADIYTSVKAYNEAQEDGYKFHATGGGSATVSPMGWTWQGGLAGTTNGRLYGFGVDQVLQIEAVLPNGNHVKFSPSVWENQEGLRYPKVTNVSGLCNGNPFEEDENLWTWEPCPEVNFDDLWFAFLGGGGGTYGIVTSVYLQLQEYPGLMTWYEITPQSVIETCGDIKAEYFEMDLENHLWSFIFDFLHDPSAVGVSKEDSNSCAGANVGFLACYGENATTAFATAWEKFFLNITKNTGIEPVPPCIQGVYKDWLETIPIIPDGQNAGMAQDDPQPSFITAAGHNILIPRSWMMNNKAKAIELIKMSITPPYFAFGGNAAIAHDSTTTSLSSSHREAGMMLFIPLGIGETVNEMYDLSDGENLPAYIGGNHYNSFIRGPQKNDTTLACNLDNWTREEVDEYCFPVQTVVWGSQNLARLESIKKNIDPNYLLDCSTCVGNYNKHSDSSTTETEINAEKSSDNGAYGNGFGGFKLLSMCLFITINMVVF